MRQSEAVNKIAISKKVGGNFDARLAITARAVLAKDNTTAYDPDNMSASLAKLLTASDSGSQISTKITGTDLTTSGVLTTLGTNIGAHDTQAQTLLTALLAITTASASFATLLQNSDLSGFPTSDPGGGKPWLNGGVLQVGA